MCSDVLQCRVRGGRRKRIIQRSTKVRLMIVPPGPLPQSVFGSSDDFCEVRTDTRGKLRCSTL